MKIRYTIMICSLLAMVGCKEESTQQQETGSNYPTMTIKRADKQLSTTYPATLRGRQDVEIRPQVSGTVTKVCVEEGAHVRKGQTLFVIDQVPYREALRKARAALTTAQAAEATARQNLEASRQLRKTNIVSDFEVHTEENNHRSALAQVEQARAEVADQTLPTGYSYEYAGMTREEATTGTSSSLMVYAICLLFIYLILCALYESLLIPFSVLLSVPFGLMGSMALARLCGIDNNIYLQTGLIMLIGLLSKTAILITEYAVARRKQGMSLTRAALSAAAVRFRPIMMTVLCMIIGMLPLVFASGVGANGNRSLGIGVVGGLLVGTLALLFVTPSFFIAFQWIEERMGKRSRQS